MYPWDVLGMEPSDDRKAIKKAYSVLLKKHRPDEDPAGFQEINQAYQTALRILKQANNEPQAEVNHSYPTDRRRSADVSESAAPEVAPKTVTAQSADEVELVHPNPEPVNVDNQRAVDPSDPDDEYQAPQQTEPDEEQLRQLHLAEELLDKLHAMAFASMEEKTELDHWGFLAGYHDIEDFTLRDQLAREVFRRVAEYNLFQRKETGLDLIPPVVLHHMAELFNWEANWLAYSQHFPEHYLQCVFTELEKPVERVRKVYHVGVSRRLFALMLDFLAYVLLMGLQASFTGLTFQGEAFYFLFTFAVFRYLVEWISPTRSSLGASYLGYRMLDQYLNLPPRGVQLRRFLALELMFLPVYVVIAGWLATPIAEIMWMLYALGLVLYSRSRNGRLPHDVLSATVAVRKM